MAARGAIAKEVIGNKILDVFEGSFRYEKEIRVPFIENGEEIQVKIVLTAAKNNVDRGDDVALPGTKSTMTNSKVNVSSGVDSATEKVAEPTEEEKKNVESLLAKLGL